MENVVVATSASGKYVMEYVTIHNIHAHIGTYQSWSICGTEIINGWNGRHMYNCGQEKYIRRVWNKRFAKG